MNIKTPKSQLPALPDMTFCQAIVPQLDGAFASDSNIEDNADIEADGGRSTRDDDDGAGDDRLNDRNPEDDDRDDQDTLFDKQVKSFLECAK